MSALEVTKVSLFIVVIPALEVAKVSLLIVFPPSQVVIPAFKVTKVALFIVSPPCPGGDPRPSNYQSVAIYGFPPCFCLCCALDFAKMRILKKYLSINFRVSKKQVPLNYCLFLFLKN